MNYERLAGATAGALALALVATVGIALAKAMTSDVGRIDYCYIDHRYANVPQPYWVVFGHVAWHQDQVITRTTSFEEAVRVRDSQCSSTPTVTP